MDANERAWKVRRCGEKKKERKQGRESIFGGSEWERRGGQKRRGNRCALECSLAGNRACLRANGRGWEVRRCGEKKKERKQGRESIFGGSEWERRGGKKGAEIGVRWMVVWREMNGFCAQMGGCGRYEVREMRKVETEWREESRFWGSRRRDEAAKKQKNRLALEGSLARRRKGCGREGFVVYFGGDILGRAVGASCGKRVV